MRRDRIQLILIGCAVLMSVNCRPARNLGPQRPDRVRGAQSWVSLGDYEARDPRRLSSLPDSVETRVREYMLDRLGADYFSRLRFVGGQVVDSARMYREDPHTRHYEWEIFGYRLGFLLREPSLGIDSYVGYLTLDWAGRPMGVAEFPPVRRRPETARLLPPWEAIKSVVGVPMTPERAELLFDAELDAFVYRFWQLVESRRLEGGTMRLVRVEAHSGRVVTDTLVSVSY